jgi:hypothetical protein
MMQAGRSLVGPAHWLCSDPHHSFWPCRLFSQTVASGYCYCCHCSLAAYQSFSLERERDWGTGRRALLPSADAFPNLPLDGPARVVVAAHSSPSGTSRLSRRTLFALKSSAGADPVLSQIGQDRQSNRPGGGKEGRLAYHVPIKSNDETPDHLITSRNQIPHPAGAGDRTGPARAYIINLPSFAPHPTLAKASSS